MCIMEIHEDATKAAMIQAVAHNLSTIDRDLDMLRKVGEARNDHELVIWTKTLQVKVHAAYADALAEYGMSIAEVVQDDKGHLHHETGHISLAGTWVPTVGYERSFAQLVKETTEEAKQDETR